jgi:hypothetical protein
LYDTLRLREEPVRGKIEGRMNRRLRFLAALLALFALSAYVGESVWASTCPPGMATPATTDGDLPEPGAHAGMHHGSAPASGDADPPRPDAPPCPLGMAGAGSSCVAAPLPAAATAMAQAALAHAATPLFLDSTHDRLLVAAHFRPPRA